MRLLSSQIFSRMSRWQAKAHTPSDPQHTLGRSLASVLPRTGPRHFWQVVKVLGLSQSQPQAPKCRCQELSITFYLRCDVILQSPLDTCASHTSSQGLVTYPDGGNGNPALNVCANPASLEGAHWTLAMETGELSYLFPSAHEENCPCCPHLDPDRGLFWNKV